jgi:quercetin dioxygenase-like cupin family protein
MPDQTDVPIVRRWEDVPSTPLADGLEMRLLGGASVSVGLAHAEAGAVVAPHSHPQEQFTYVLSGRMRFTLGLDDEQRTVGPEEIVQIPGGATHSVEVLEASVYFEVFAPRRDELHALPVSASSG